VTSRETLPVSKTVKRMLATAALLCLYPLTYFAAFGIDSFVAFYQDETGQYCLTCVKVRSLFGLTIWDWACTLMLVAATGLTIAAWRMHQEDRAESARY
jgi:hypothetical protein